MLTLPPSPRDQPMLSSGSARELWSYIDRATLPEVERMAEDLIAAYHDGERDDYELAHFAVGCLWLMHLDPGLRVGALVREHGDARHDAWVRWRALATWLSCAPHPGVCPHRTDREPRPPPGRHYDWAALLGFGLRDGLPDMSGISGTLAGVLDQTRRILNGVG